MTTNSQIVPVSAALEIDTADTIVVASGTAVHVVPGQPSDVQSVYVPNIEIGPKRFRESFNKVAQVVQEAAQFGSPDQPGFYAAEIELRLEVMAGGDLRILTGGAEMNATGGIRVLFKRGKQE